MAGQIEPESLTWRVTPDLLGVLDASGYFKSTNPAWYRTLGFRADEIESKQFFEFIHPDDLDATNAAFTEIQTGQPVLGFENRYRHKDGSYRWLSWNAVPENDLFFCSARDITHHVINAASLKTKEDEGRLREQFIAILGHDLRNPVAAVGAAMRLLAQEEQSDRSLQIIEATNQSVDRMSRLLNDLMDFAKIRLGQGLTVALEECDVGGVIERVTSEVRMAHSQADIRSDINLSGAHRLDPLRFGQLLANLLANAATHGSPSDPIFLTADDSGDVLRITVRNSGGRIPDATLPQIFEPFARGDENGAVQGLGLGLFIAHQIAQAHGGLLAVVSDQSGTTFTFMVSDRV